MWSSAKQYKVSLIVLAVLFAVGIAFQLIFGALDMHILAYPVSLIIVAVILLAIVGMTLYRESVFFRWFSGIPFSVSVIGAVVLCSIVMGLIPQNGGHGDFLSRLGLYAINYSWAFTLLYLTLLLSLGSLVATELIGFKPQRWAFMLNHLGLWLVLLGAGIGSADYREMKVRIDEGESVVHASDKSGRMTAMPFAIRLDDFRMEEYPVKWGVVDVRTNKFQPEKRPVFYESEHEAFAANKPLNTHLRIASTIAEPSGFSSDITIVTHDGVERKATIGVNHPYRSGSWAIYQLGYDQTAGKESSYSILQLVRDQWLAVVYVGIVMLAVGAISLFRTKQGKVINKK